MKKRKTIARWLSEVISDRPDLKRKADELDRKIDKRVSAQMRDAVEKSPETDWRMLSRKEGLN